MGFPHLTASFSRQERGFPPLFPQLFKRREKGKEDFGAIDFG
jgi:hypothetical protein